MHIIKLKDLKKWLGHFAICKLILQSVSYISDIYLRSVYLSRTFILSQLQWCLPVVEPDLHEEQEEWK